MILANNKIKIPSFWYHDSELKDKNGNTVAMIIAKTRKIPDKVWQHKPQMKNDNSNKIIPPKEWHHKAFL